MTAVLSSRAMFHRVCRRVCHRVSRRCVAPARAVLAVAALAGCGPVATSARSAARRPPSRRPARPRPSKYAPYWWTRATEYLHRAREVAAHADYQGASRFGRLAAEAATRAAADARIAARDPSKRPLDFVPDAAPAKPTVAPVAPTRDLPAPGKDRVAPAKDRPDPAPRPPPRPPSPVAPAKDPP